MDGPKIQKSVCVCLPYIYIYAWNGMLDKLEREYANDEEVGAKELNLNKIIKRIEMNPPKHITSGSFAVYTCMLVHASYYYYWFMVTVLKNQTALQINLFKA